MKIPGYLLAVLIIWSAGLTAQSQIRKIVDLSISPVSAFKNYCARCHGEEGSSYGNGFANLQDDSLKNIVEDMMFGPGGLNPGSAEIDAMVSYNKSLRNKTPFAAALNSKSFMEGKDKYLIIETSPGAKVEAMEKEIGVVETKNNRELFFDPKKLAAVKITVTKNNTSSVLNFPSQLWTH